MLKWIMSHKKRSIIFICLISIFVLFIIPLIISKVFYSDHPSKFFKVEYNVSDVLNFYSAILTFLGTVSLGIITVYQNYISQQKTDEVNRLTLELQQKSMAMAEQNYKSSAEYSKNKINIPKFEISILGYTGYYAELEVRLKNVSDFIVSGIKAIIFEVIDEDGFKFITSNYITTSSHSITAGQEARVKFHNEELLSSPHEIGQQRKSLKNATLIWSFQCENPMGELFYYRASRHINDSSITEYSLWDVERVG